MTNYFQKSLALFIFTSIVFIFSQQTSFASSSEDAVSSIQSIYDITIGDNLETVLDRYQNDNEWEVAKDVPYLTVLSRRSNYTSEGGYHSRSYIDIGTPHSHNKVLSTNYKIAYRSNGIMYKGYLKSLIKNATANFGEPEYSNAMVTINNKFVQINSPTWEQDGYILKIVTYEKPGAEYPYIISIQRSQSIR